MGLYRGELAPTLVLRLAVQLPVDSRFTRAVSGPKSDWSTSDYLIAHAVDLLAGANYQRGGAKGKKPKPVERPGTKKAVIGKNPKQSQDQIKQFFASRQSGATT